MALFKRKNKEENSAETEDKKSASGAASPKKENKASMKDLYKTEGKQEKKKEVKTDEKKADSTDESKKEEKTAPPREISVSGKAYEILVKPVITERSGDLGAQNKYVFEVADKANKVEVSKAVKEVYGIRPVKVNIIKMKGKRVRFGRIYGKRKNRKKAIVTLPQGKTINVYEGV